MNTIGKKIETEAQPDQPAAAEPHDAVLGSLSGNTAQDSGSITTDAKDLSKARKTTSASSDPDQLTLPKGAVVSMRKSGGMRFSSRTVTVHRDGQITHSITGTGERSLMKTMSKSAIPSRITNEQLSQLKITVAKAGLDAPAAAKIGAPKQSPDAYAYEIVARIGTKQTAVEVLDGSIPDNIKPLIRELNALMPKV